MISTERLTKRYGANHALRDLSLEVRPGEVFGLLGPNGSGKTTTIRLLLGMIKPTSGKASVAGRDCWKESLAVRERVSYLPGELRLYGHMTGYAFLKFLSDLRGGASIDRAAAIADRVLKVELTRKIRTFSTGMKQKLALSQAFADPVDILILDEPTSALDPSARDVVLDLVKAARAERQTVVFSGHVLPEVEAVADRVAIMRKGRLMHLEDMHQRRTNLRLVLVRFDGSEAVPRDFPEHLELAPRELNGEVVLLEHRGSPVELFAWLAGQRVVDIAIGTDDLKSLYDRFHGPNVVDDEFEDQ